MCQFITFCDSVSCLLRAFPLFVQLVGSIEGNVGYINSGSGLTRRRTPRSNNRRSPARSRGAAERRNGNLAARSRDLLAPWQDGACFSFHFFVIKHLFMITDTLPYLSLCSNVAENVSMFWNLLKHKEPKLISGPFIFPKIRRQGLIKYSSEDHVFNLSRKHNVSLSSADSRNE